MRDAPKALGLLRVFRTAMVEIGKQLILERLPSAYRRSALPQRISSQHPTLARTCDSNLSPALASILLRQCIT